MLDARAGVGGVEAAHFLGQLGRCWRLYSERRGWRFEQLRVTRTEQGDPSEFIASVSGEGAYAALRHEAGVHRVQRVPAAQRSSANAKKMQTSAVLCAVLPEAREGDEHADIPTAGERPTARATDVRRSNLAPAAASRARLGRTRPRLQPPR